VNGVQESFPGDAGDQELDAPGQFVDSSEDQEDSGPNGYTIDYVHMDLSNVPASFYESFSGVGSGYGSFFYCNLDNCSNVAETFGGDLNPTSVVAVVTGVPEPATWAMLILGVAMAGFAARRRGETPALTA
jgi:hypothetical protein